jgi:hypothetical protein
MGLIVEISIDIQKKPDVTEAKIFLSELAETHNCNSEYYIYETEGYNCKIERNECIHIVEFNTPLTENEKINIVNYLIKIINKNYINLDTIYKEDGKIDIIYNSIKSQFTNVNGKEKIIKNKPIINEIKKKLYNQ